jgi:hypothetical protein
MSYDSACIHTGLGRATAKHLLRTGEYHVIGAVRDLDKVRFMTSRPSVGKGACLRKRRHIRLSMCSRVLIC